MAPHGRHILLLSQFHPRQTTRLSIIQLTMQETARQQKSAMPQLTRRRRTKFPQAIRRTLLSPEKISRSPWPALMRFPAAQTLTSLHPSLPAPRKTQARAASRRRRERLPAATMQLTATMQQQKTMLALRTLRFPWGRLTQRKPKGAPA